ncbi:hypothetical protein D5S17_22470 [Pseudonocardiaceae bacterium YIM PH 21723]|nr:hypothetical protein D5S17_22470 [Pseudonocardiaceae bacterium YIM PH 21723]
MTASEPAAPRHPGQMRNHWWWRPGWRYGRRLYTWMLTFEGQRQLHAQVNRYQRALQTLDGFDLTPLEWLHVTLQPVGFTDEVGDDRIRAIVDSAQDQLRDLGTLRLSFRPPSIGLETVSLPVQPSGALQQLNQSIRDTTLRALGQEPGKPAEPRVPRLDVAYSHSTTFAAFAAATIADTGGEPVTAELSGATLVAMHRDHQMYEWTVVDSIKFG